MAHWLSDQGVRPTKILCSSAQRTRETVGLMCEFWQDEINVTYNESLYLASPESIFQTICTEGERAERLMVVAHNPGMSQLSSAMANTSIEMPTAAVAVFKVGADRWSEFGSQTPLKLVQTMRPKALS